MAWRSPDSVRYQPPRSWPVPQRQIGGRRGTAAQCGHPRSRGRPWLLGLPQPRLQAVRPGARAQQGLLPGAHHRRTSLQPRLRVVGRATPRPRPAAPARRGPRQQRARSVMRSRSSQPPRSAVLASLQARAERATGPRHRGAVRRARLSAQLAPPERMTQPPPASTRRPPPEPARLATSEAAPTPRLKAARTEQAPKERAEQARTPPTQQAPKQPAEQAPKAPRQRAGGWRPPPRPAPVPRRSQAAPPPMVATGLGSPGWQTRPVAAPDRPPPAPGWRSRPVPLPHHRRRRRSRRRNRLRPPPAAGGSTRDPAAE